LDILSERISTDSGKRACNWLAKIHKRGEKIAPNGEMLFTVGDFAFEIEEISYKPNYNITEL
jgi:hypothetical protein